MVRKYKLKTEKRDDDNVLRALRAIEEGMSMRAVARDFQLLEATLRFHWNRNKAQNETEDTDSLLSVSTTTSTVVSSEPASTSASMEQAQLTSTENEAATTTTTMVAETTPARQTPTNFIVRSAGAPTVSFYKFLLIKFTRIGHLFWIDSNVWARASISICMPTTEKNSIKLVET